MGSSDPIEGVEPFKSGSHGMEVVSSFVRTIEALGQEPCIAVYSTMAGVHAVYGPPDRVAQRVREAGIANQSGFLVIGVRTLSAEVFKRDARYVVSEVRAQVEALTGVSNQPAHTKKPLHTFDARSSAK